jgi:hypothetical protein
MSPKEAVIWQAPCACGARIGERCRTPTGRNHPGRVRAAIEQALYDLVLYDLAYPHNEGYRLRERQRRGRR